MSKSNTSGVEHINAVLNTTFVRAINAIKNIHEFSLEPKFGPNADCRPHALGNKATVFNC